MADLPVNFNQLPSTAGTTDPQAGSRPTTAKAISGIGNLAAVEREASAANTSGESRAQALQFGNAGIDPLGPATGELGPIAALRDTVIGELRQFGAYFFEREADLLCEDDKGYAANHGSGVAAVAGIIPFGSYESQVLIEAKGGGGDASSFGQGSDGNHVSP